MDTVDAGLVLLPRFTTLVGATSFTTAPVDLSQQGGAQFMVWRGPIRVSSGTGTLTLNMEESLEGHSWSLGPVSPEVMPVTEILGGDPQFFSYSVRLRWFRLRLTLTGANPMVSCWAEGLLRGGGGGFGGPAGPAAWPAGSLASAAAPAPATGAMGQGWSWGVPGAGGGPGGADPWAKVRVMIEVMRRQGLSGYTQPALAALDAAMRAVRQEWARLHPGVPIPPPPLMPANPWLANPPQHEEILRGK